MKQLGMLWCGLGCSYADDDERGLMRLPGSMSGLRDVRSWGLILTLGEAMGLQAGWSLKTGCEARQRCCWSARHP
eukprot:1803022-Rhodomonas_salina.2